jgi:hypothetical protein
MDGTMNEVLEHFECSHLPTPLREVSQAFHDLAHKLDEELRDGREKTKALDALLVAKDAAVRQRRKDTLQTTATITLNGKQMTVERNLTFERIEELSGQTRPSVTYIKKLQGDTHRQGMLRFGQTLCDVDGLIISAYNTGSA